MVAKFGNNFSKLGDRGNAKTLSASNDSVPPKCQELGAHRSLPQKNDSREMVITKLLRIMTINNDIMHSKGSFRAFDQATGLVNGRRTLGRIPSCEAFGFIDEA